LNLANLPARGIKPALEKNEECLLQWKGSRAEARRTPKCVPARLYNSLKANGAEVAQLVEQPIRKAVITFWYD
jgi:hypothetical protein